MPLSSDSPIGSIAIPRIFAQLGEFLAAQLFRFEERRKHERLQQSLVQVQTIQRNVFRQIHPQFLERHGRIEGSRLAQLTVDKLFGRSNSLKDYENFLAERFAAELACENQIVREAAFISLLAMLEVERVTCRASAARRIVDTLNWLKQFGDIPADAEAPEALAIIGASLCKRPLPIREIEAPPPPARRLKTLPLLSSAA